MTSQPTNHTPFGAATPALHNSHPLDLQCGAFQNTFHQCFQLPVVRTSVSDASQRLAK